MGADIRLLEELVSEAVDRLKRHSEERGRLEQQVQALRDEIEALSAPGRSLRPAGEGREDEGAPMWEAQRTRVVSELRGALVELRGLEGVEVRDGRAG